METILANQEATETKTIRSGPLGKKWVAVTLVLICVAMSWIGVVDYKTEEYVDGAIKQALFAYGGARALNAGISLLQSAEIGAGIGVDASIHPFEVLDPVNDMVEDYATAMKYAIGSLMTQKLLVEILSTNVFKWLITGVAAFFIVSLLMFNGQYSTPLFKGFLFVTLVRFLFVTTILFCGLVDNAFISDKTEAEISRVEHTAQTVNQLEQGKTNLTQNERDTINEQILGLETRRNDLSKDLEDQRERVASAHERLSEIEGIQKGINGNRTLKDKINIFKKDENYSEAKQDTRNAKTTYKEQLKTQEEIESQLEEVQTSFADKQELLYGKKSFLSKVKSKVSSVIDLANINHIKQTVNDSIESMLMLISLFVFKTLIMPLIFLALILRAFKAVWGIDPRSLLKERYGVTTREETIATTSQKS